MNSNYNSCILLPQISCFLTNLAPNAAGPVNKSCDAGTLQLNVKAVVIMLVYSSLVATFLKGLFPFLYLRLIYVCRGFFLFDQLRPEVTYVKG